MRTNTLPFSTDTPKNDLFTQSMLSFVTVLKKVFLPHLLAGMGLFLLAAYASYLVLIKPLGLPAPLEFITAGVLFGVYSLVSFAYSILAACVFAVRSACTAWEDCLDSSIELVKKNIAVHLENMNEGIAKDQAKVLVSGSVREVFRQMGKNELKHFPRWLAASFLGAVTLALRSVLMARIVQISGTTVKLGKIFAGKAALVTAVFLNLRLFSALALILVYAAGAFLLAVNFLFVFWIK